MAPDDPAVELFSRILVAVDGSAPSEAVVQLALRLAVPSQHATFRFASVFEHAAAHAAQAEWKSSLDQATESARAPGFEATHIMRTGSAVDAILDEAREWKATCIAIGTHGRRGIPRAFLGSCAEDVLHRSDVAVLVAHASSADGGDALARILCAVDDSAVARRAFDAAAALVAERRAELHVLFVVQIADEHAAGFELEGSDADGSIGAIYAEARAGVKALAARAIDRGARIKPHVLGGADVAERIVQCATVHRCGLIVLGAHGGGGVSHAVLGSTAGAVLRSSRIPVLAFRDQRERAEVARHADAITAP